MYSGKEPYTIVGITSSLVELYGDFSGGTNYTYGKAWLPREGLVTDFHFPKGCIELVQYKAPFYTNIIAFIEQFKDKPEDIFVKDWDNKDEHRNISSSSGTSHLAIKTQNGKVKLNNGDWVIHDNEGNYFVSEKNYADEQPPSVYDNSGA